MIKKTKTRIQIGEAEDPGGSREDVVMAVVVADEQVKSLLGDGWPGSDAAADRTVGEGATMIWLESFLLLCLYQSKGTGQQSGST